MHQETGPGPEIETSTPNDDNDPPTKRPTWIGDALLPKTSPVVPWNQDTLKEARKLESTLKLARIDDARNAKLIPGLRREMEDAWADAKYG